MTDPSGQFTDEKYNQNIVNLYPEYDRDNIDANPPSAVSYAKRFPLGDVVTNDLKKSITRETTNKFIESFDVSNTVSLATNNNNNSVLTFTEEHGLGSLKNYATLNGGSGHTNGTYYNVKLFNTNAVPTSAVWDGATADVTVSGGSVTSVNIVEGGSSYTNGEQLYFDSSSVADGGIAGSPSANIVINTAGISSATGNYVQVTGITTGTDSYHRITAINNTKQIIVAKTASETILNGQQVIDLGPWSAIESSSFSSNTTTITTHKAHGLMVGNKFRVLNSSDVSLGDFVVTGVGNTDVFTMSTTSALTDPKYILKHGLSDNESISGKEGENLGVRGLSFFDHETLILNEAITSAKSSFKVTLSDATVNSDAIKNRFPLGSYIQIDGEIMRVASSVIASGDQLTVIRGALGTISSAHSNGSKIKKIKPLPIELRRPSILRASGHTFEYVGYGPGNYSTALPQLQNRSLSEREEFLTQSQETSCGNVVYTGMNDKGDFYIGNTKIASASGQQTTFDIPIPTITGEDPNRLSLVADEIIVKERLLVEGGVSKQILSQFDGPVTFNENVRLANPNKRLDVTGEIKVASTGNIRVHNTANSTSTTTGSIVTLGGVGIGKSMHIGGDIVGLNTPDIVGFGSITAATFYGDGANLTNTGATLFPSGTNGDTQKVVLTHLTSGTMTLGTTDADLTFTSSTNTLGVPNITGDLTGDVTGDLTGNVTGNVTGNADTATTAGNLSFGSANQIVYKDASNNGATSGNFTFDSATNKVSLVGILTVTGSGTFDSIKIDGSHISNVNPSPNQAIFLHPKGDANVKIGQNSNNDLEVEGDIIAFSSSDVTLKENVTLIPNSLDKVLSLTGNTFTWKTGHKYEGQNDTGVIAQEVEALGLPGITTTSDDGTKRVRYDRLVPLLIEAVKELSAKVSALEGS